MAPEGELLTIGYVINSQNALYSLIGGGLHWCDGGVGPYWARGKFNTCGSLDGSRKYSSAYLGWSPSGDVSSASNVVGQLATILTSDRLSARNRALVEIAYGESLLEDGAEEAVKVAQSLIITSPEFHSTGKIDLTEDKRTAPPQRTAKGSEYKAIVHVTLFGGMDSMNMLVPHPDGCQALYDEYFEKRTQDLALKASEMVKISATTSNQPCSYFGVHKNLSNLAEIYASGEAIFVTQSGK